MVNLLDGRTGFAPHLNRHTNSLPCRPASWLLAEKDQSTLPDQPLQRLAVRNGSEARLHRLRLTGGLAVAAVCLGFKWPFDFRSSDEALEDVRVIDVGLARLESPPDVATYGSSGGMGLFHANLVTDRVSAQIAAAASAWRWPSRLPR